MTSDETKVCQNCRQPFVINASDFAFYERIQVPPPTWCPECRFRRRMTWRNDWHLFLKTDARTGKKIFSLFPEESPVKIYEKEFWLTDHWDPMDYGRDYDFSKSFFEQFQQLMLATPLPAISVMNMSNCSYCTNAGGLSSTAS